MSSFSELESRHREMIVRLGERGLIELPEAKVFIAEAVAKSPGIEFFEDRMTLRGILRFWGSYVSGQGDAFPDVDIDRPDRKPEAIKARKAPRPRRSRRRAGESEAAEGSIESTLAKVLDSLSKMKAQLDELGEKVDRLEDAWNESPSPADDGSPFGFSVPVRRNSPFEEALGMSLPRKLERRTVDPGQCHLSRAVSKPRFKWSPLFSPRLSVVRPTSPPSFFVVTLPSFEDPMPSSPEGCPTERDLGVFYRRSPSDPDPLVSALRSLWTFKWKP